VLARWVDTELFWAAVTLRFLPQNAGNFFASPEAAAAFAADRANFAQGATIRRMPLEEALPRYRLFMAELEAQLGDGRAHLFGADWTIADFSVYHVLWFIHASGAMAEDLARHPKAKAWFERMRVHGVPQGRPMSGSEALDVARAASPAAVAGAASDLADVPPGALVDVGPTDYGVMPSRGELVHCDDHAIVISRRHERTGPVNVHFPRHGFAVTRV
jgi:glutathione S-transferase